MGLGCLRSTGRRMSCAFRADEWTDADAPYARRWLASRRKEVDHQLSARAIDDARLQALAAADPLNGKTAAMVLEAAARASGELINHLGRHPQRRPQPQGPAGAGQTCRVPRRVLVDDMGCWARLRASLGACRGLRRLRPIRSPLPADPRRHPHRPVGVHGRRGDQPRWAIAIEFAGAAAAGIIAATVS